MTQKKLGNLNVKNENVLNRDEMKLIIAGSGGCRVAYRNANGSFQGYSGCMDCGVASNMYNNGWYDNDSGVYASGYCGASCGSGSFSNGSSCY